MTGATAGGARRRARTLAWSSESELLTTWDPRAPARPLDDARAREPRARRPRARARAARSYEYRGQKFVARRITIQCVPCLSSAPGSLSNLRVRQTSGPLRLCEMACTVALPLLLSALLQPCLAGIPPTPPPPPLARVTPGSQKNIIFLLTDVSDRRCLRARSPDLRPHFGLSSNTHSYPGDVSNRTKTSDWARWERCRSCGRTCWRRERT